LEVNFDCPIINLVNLAQHFKAKSSKRKLQKLQIWSQLKTSSSCENISYSQFTSR